MNQLVINKIAKRFKSSAGDARTSYFIRALKHILKQGGSPSKVLATKCDIEEACAERIIEDFVSERFVSFSSRRNQVPERLVDDIGLLLSQGYKQGQVWRNIPLGKTCYDICIYQNIIQIVRPRTIIEFGTGMGGSAFFFRDICNIFDSPAKILTIDVDNKDIVPELLTDENIKFIEGDTRNIKKILPCEMLEKLPHSWLVVEDCHRNIINIIFHLTEYMEVGDYFIVEDITNSKENEISNLNKKFPKIFNRVFMVDTFYTDMFGRNNTCSPDSIFRKML